MGLRKVPAAGSDNAVGSAEREEREVTARESRSPITRKLSVPELGRRRSTQAHESYFGAFFPETGEKSQAGTGGLFPGARDAVGPSLDAVVPGTAMLQSQRGVAGCDRDGASTAKAGLTPAGPFLGTKTGHFMPS